MKHVTYYLLVSISFPYIHTRQVGYNEGPQLLVVGELKWGHKALEVGCSWHGSYPNTSWWLLQNLPFSSIQTPFCHTHICFLNPRTVQLLVLLAIKSSSVL